MENEGIVISLVPVFVIWSLKDDAEVKIVTQ